MRIFSGPVGNQQNKKVSDRLWLYPQAITFLDSLAVLLTCLYQTLLEVCKEHTVVETSLNGNEKTEEVRVFFATSKLREWLNF